MSTKTFKNKKRNLKLSLKRTSKYIKRGIYKNIKGGESKEVLCSQAIVNIPRLQCINKCKTPDYFIKENQISKIDKLYGTQLKLNCKNNNDFDCNQKFREGKGKKLLDKLSQLEASLAICKDKNCKQYNDKLNDCVELGEEKCRIKYKKLIETLNPRYKILPLDKCKS